MTTGIDLSNIDAWWASRQKADTKEWIRISAEMGEWVRELSKRDDLVAFVEPGSGKGAPAVYIPEMGHIEVNPDVCAFGVDPSDIHMDTETGRLENAAFAGAGGHEGGHAAHSLWPIDQDPKKRRVVQAALLLEESAMEGDLVRTRPETRVFLRSTFDKIVNQSKEPIETIAGAAHMAALCHGRVDAGVLDAVEAQPVIDLCKSVIGERYDALRQVWLDVHKIGVRDDASVMEAHGQRWLDILGDDAADEAGDGATLIFICGNEPGDDDSDGSGQGSVVKVVAEAVSEAAEKEAGEQADAAKNRDEAAQRDKDAAEGRKNEEAAERTFVDIKFVGHGAGYGDEGLERERPATAEEMGHASALSQAIARAQYRERSRTVRASTVPPGRLRGGAAMRRSAERSMGIMSTTEPWKQTIRRHTDQPPITVAIGCDISGSMRRVTEAVASAAWMIARAVHQNEGDAATVAYGNRVHAVVRPGERPEMIREFNANGGMENFVGAQRALNGALNLESATGVRLLVIISDGQYTSRQREEGDIMATRLMRSGVKILWLGFNGVPRDTITPGAEYARINDPSNIGRIIGSKMVELLERA